MEFVTVSVCVGWRWWRFFPFAAADPKFMSDHPYGKYARKTAGCVEQVLGILIAFPGTFAAIA
jgi:hypothetical protein